MHVVAEMKNIHNKQYIDTVSCVYLNFANIENWAKFWQLIKLEKMNLK